MSRASEPCAAEIMTREMITVELDAPIQEAAALLIDHEISGAPVRDEYRRIVGLISLRDIARFERERECWTVERGEEREPRRWSRPGSSARWPGKGLPWSYPVESAGQAQVRHFMTPIPIAVPEETALSELVQTMLECKVHRVLVRDAEGEIVGIVSAIDVLRHLSLGRRGQPSRGAAPDR